MSTYCYDLHNYMIYKNKCLNSNCIEYSNTYDIIKSSFKLVYIADSGNPIIPQVKKNISLCKKKKYIYIYDVNIHH